MLVIIPPRFFLSAVSPLCTQHGALKEVQPLGVFFLPVGKLVRIVDWIRFIMYILLSVKYFVNHTCVTSAVAPAESDIVVNASEVKMCDCCGIGERVGS